MRLKMVPTLYCWRFGSECVRFGYVGFVYECVCVFTVLNGCVHLEVF
jgi:hypothetical protein